MSLLFVGNTASISVYEDVVLGWLIKPSMGHSFVFSSHTDDAQDLGTTDLKEAIHKVTAIVVAHKLTAAP